jgi:hypothetical protein
LYWSLVSSLSSPHGMQYKRPWFTMKWEISAAINFCFRLLAYLLSFASSPFRVYDLHHLWKRLLSNHGKIWILR